MIYYIATFNDPERDSWTLLGYDSDSYIGALRQCKESFPKATQFKSIGDVYQYPVSDEAVILAEGLMNVFNR